MSILIKRLHYLTLQEAGASGALGNWVLAVIACQEERLNTSYISAAVQQSYYETGLCTITPSEAHAHARIRPKTPVIMYPRVSAGGEKNLIIGGRPATLQGGNRIRTF